MSVQLNLAEILIYLYKKVNKVRMHIFEISDVVTAMSAAKLAKLLSKATRSYV